MHSLGGVWIPPRYMEAIILYADLPRLNCYKELILTSENILLFWRQNRETEPLIEAAWLPGHDIIKKSLRYTKLKHSCNIKSVSLWHIIVILRINFLMTRYS